ncbi:hypothetical protein GDO86_017009 [Hymenochirus boettgeri]|uniref:Methyltransferase type 11 domain-containing protein n=1 Tax=Hymenochirus boettgeri TaxID=247094 RepID=A0A8T2INH5_9PIPI|nr:hypothetical protein GDO86_017009 [Hymenochirus boettgeri]
MDTHIFQNKDFSAAYQKGMFLVSEKVNHLVLSYLEEKKGKPFELAIDAGCGTGISTRMLAPYFQKVIGIDMSESQLSEARKMTSQKNIHYQISKAEKMPVDDSSVDLLHSALAAHWFDPEMFAQETARVLKPGGCLALQSASVVFEIRYNDCTEKLSRIFSEAIKKLLENDKHVADILKSQYEDIFRAIPFLDKKRITDIQETFLVTVPDIMDLIRAVCLYHTFLEQDKEKAVEFLQDLEKSFFSVLGESASDTRLELNVKFFCLLASKA